MSVSYHGLSVGIERQGDRFHLTIKATGKLTHADYEVITPMLDAALEGAPAATVDILFDATEFEGWELRAAWDDFKLGLKHGRKMGKVAILGNRRWQDVAARVGSWFISGEIRYFEYREDALEWLRE